MTVNTDEEKLQKTNISIMTGGTEGLMRKLKKERVKQDKRNLNRSPFLVSTFGIYSIAFSSKIYFDHFDFL